MVLNLRNKTLDSCQCHNVLCHFKSSGIGPKRAIDLIKQYKCIEEIIKHIDTNVSQHT